MSEHGLSYWLTDTSDTGRLWRSILLFGSNTASYKFALGSTLLELASEGIDQISTPDLAVPFSKRICERLKQEDKQGTNPTSGFLKACRQYNAHEVDLDVLVSATLDIGFRWVLDAFHIVAGEELHKTLYEVSGKGKNRVVHLDDDLLNLGDSNLAILDAEVGARWRLVETSWALGVPAHLLDVQYDDASEDLYVVNTLRKRKSVGNTKWALNGYQDGRCFYCKVALETTDVVSEETHVDHVIPFSVGLKTNFDVDHIWNLVNACKTCNSSSSKSNKMPLKRFLTDLHRRNEYYIFSNHPLKDSIIRATGNTTRVRARFLDRSYKEAETVMPVYWGPS